MTVADLIKQLKALDPTKEVWLTHTYHHPYEPVKKRTELFREETIIRAYGQWHPEDSDIDPKDITKSKDVVVMYEPEEQ